jgi:2-polyprenyl-3-methyl-5-hydroxy-6-metoxy-1,4-benzoquinol methylase
MKIIKKSNSKNTKMNSEWTESAEKNHFWMQWRFYFLVKILQKIKININKKLKIMDLGCGNGILSNQIEERFNVNVDRVDSSIDMLKKNEKVRGKLICYNIGQKISKFKNKYDLIFLFDVIEHVKNDKKFFYDIIYHLKPGGILIINVPSLQIFYSKYDKAVGHLRRYCKKDFDKLIDNKIAQIISVDYWGVFLIPMLFLRKIFLFFFHTNQNNKIVKQGWKASKLLNYFMKKIMKIEINFFNKQIVGTSLMIFIKKNELF